MRLQLKGNIRIKNVHLTEKLWARGRSTKERISRGQKKAKANLKPRWKTWSEGDEPKKETKRYQENFYFPKFL